MSARNGQPPIVSFTVTRTAPSSATETAGTIPSETMSLPSSGSITDSRTAITSSRVGAGIDRSGAMDGILPVLTV